MATNRSVEKFQRVMAAVGPAILAPIKAETFRQAEILRGTMLLKVPANRGRLRSTIRTEQGAKPMRVLVKAGGDATRVHGYDYAIAQEFGTQHNQAQPFFWPSYRARKARIRREIKKAARAAINQIVPLK